MRPLQCPSCGQSLGATVPGTGGRRTCARCHFSFVPIHGADAAATERFLDRYPAAFLGLALLPFLIGGVLQIFDAREIGQLLRLGTETGQDAGPSGGQAGARTPPLSSRPAVARSSTSAFSARTSVGRYPAVIERVSPAPPGLVSAMLPMPGGVVPPTPPVPMATLEVNSIPTGAAVVDDSNGVGLGSTPLVLNLHPGPYRLRLSMPGRKLKLATLSLAAGEASRLIVDLNEEVKPASGLLVLDSDPIQAETYLNGVLVGATPLSLEVPGGRDVQVLLRAPGHEDLVVSARVPPGGRQNVRAILPPLARSATPVLSGEPGSAEDPMRRLTEATGTAPPLGPYRSAMPVVGSASGLGSLTAGISPDREGTISGLVRMRGTPPPIELLPVTVDNAVCGTSPRASEKLIVAPSGGLQNVVVRLVDSALDKQLGPPRVESSLQIADCTLLPHVQAIPAGTTVRVSNLQSVPFDLQFVDLAGLTTPLLVGRGAIGLPLIFKTAGIFRVFDTGGHAWMQASIHVMPNPYFTISDAAGQFTLRGVPKGRYVLQCWHELLGTKAGPVSVSAGQTTTALYEFPAPASQ